MTRPALGYVRVSTEQQTGETKTSLADQRAAVERLAAKLGVTVAEWFVDDGYSGATYEQRPALRALVARCEGSPCPARAPGLVLALNDSRWGRFPNSEEATYWRVHLDRRGWRVQFAEGDDVQDTMLRPVLRSIVQTQATQYREQVKANAKRGSRGTASQGFWISRAPYGYRRKVVYPPGRERVLEAGVRKAPDEKIVLVPHPDEAAVVRELFRRYAAGADTLYTLTEWLARAMPGRRWTRQAVRFTLANPAYLGDVVAGRVPSDTHERAITPIRPDAEWYGKQNAHEPIVSRAMFAAVEARAAEHEIRRRGALSPWVLSGLVRCRCGKSLAAGGAGRQGQSPSYRCVTRGAHPSDRCPYPGTVLKTWLEETVIDEVARVVASPRAVRRLDALLGGVLARIEGAPEEELARLDRERQATELRRARLVGAIAAGTITDADARSTVMECRNLLARIADDRARIERGLVNRATMEAEREAVLAMASTFRETVRQVSGATQRELLRPWLRSATFDTDTRLVSLEIRHVPLVLTADLTRMPCRPAQEPVTRRVVPVGRPA
jgi:DNA invertase Pin-like site-specific DNA recombinase